MIIEFFGPPGVGKTTLVHALAARLRERGHAVKLVLSLRPIEAPVRPPKEKTRPQAFAVARRLVRPVSEIFAEAGASRDRALRLLELLPPKSVVWSLRLHLYLRRLSRSWDEATRRSEVVLFDQGFIQAVCSLVMLARAADSKLVELALDIIPEPDLIVRLEAPAAILKARLADRLRRQARLERMLELDVETNLASVRVVDQLHELLRERGQPVTSVESADPQGLSRAVDRIEGLVAAFELASSVRAGAERA
jgi:thymidylate kinase